MIRHAIIDLSDNHIVTVVDYDSDISGSTPPGFKTGYVAIANERVGPDWTFDGSELHPPVVAPQPVPVPTAVTRVQLLLGMFKAGMITEADAVAAATVGAIPPALAAAISQLPDDQAAEARIRFATFTHAGRADALVMLLAQVLGKTSGEIDQFFIFCNQL